MISSPKLQSLSSLFFHSTLSFRCQEAFIDLLPHLTLILSPHSLTLSYHPIALLSLPPLIPQALIPLAPSFHPVSHTIILHHVPYFLILSLHSFYPTPSRHSNHLIYCLTLISQSFILLKSLLSPHSLTSSSYLTRSSISLYSSPKSPAPVLTPHFPTTPLSLSSIPFTPLLIPYYISHSVDPTLSYISPHSLAQIFYS